MTKNNQLLINMARTYFDLIAEVLQKVPNQFPSIHQLSLEGRFGLYQSAATYPTTPTNRTLNQTIVNLKYTAGQGRAGLILTMSAGADGPCRIQTAILKAQGVSSFAEAIGAPLSGCFGANGGNQSSIVSQIVGETGYAELLMFSNTATQYVHPCAAIGVIDFTGDFNYSAKNIVLFLTDSKGRGSMGDDTSVVPNVPYTTDYLYPFKITEKLNLAGKSFRQINKGMNGMQSTQIASELDSGMYDVRPRLVVVDTGLNDSNGLAVPVATYKTNLQKIIYRRNRFWPNAAILFMGQPNSDLSGISPNAAAYRAAMVEVATSSIGGVANKVCYYDASTAYPLAATAATDVNFRSTERSAGARLHPSGLGHGLIADGMWAVLSAQPWFADL